MFKTILRTLSALSIVTITASAGFAQSTGDTDCAASWNQDHEDCTATTKIWLESISAEPLPIDDIRNTNGKANRFVRFGPNGFNDAEGNLIIRGASKRGKLNLKADVTQDDETIVNEIIGGVLFYRNFHLASTSYNYYAGIKSGTDLGRPLSEDIVEAGWTDDWNGKIRTVWKGNSSYHLETDFELTITFNGGTGKVGDIYALVNRQGTAHYLIDGEFDSKGVITGKVTYGLFNASDSLNSYTNIGRIDGTLSGLIGDQGAVGVFVSDKDDSNNGLNGFSGGFVVSGFSEGKSALLRACSLDPFDVQCSDTEFDSRKTARIEYCITGDNALGSSKDCVGAIAATGANSCILNPFQTACADDADYSAQYVAARADRAVFCGKSANSGTSELCRGDTIVADVCGVNPFGEVCEDIGDSTTHNDRRVDLMNNCNDDTRNNAECSPIEHIIKACEEKPFGANCGFAALDETRKTLTGYCLGESPNILCTDDIRDEVLERPNAATWANSLKTSEGNPIVLSNLPDRGTYVQNRGFLKNIESAQTNADITIYIDRDGETLYKSLNLKTTKFNGMPLGGHEDDGMARFRNDLTSRSRYIYSGIFSTTDLGAPVTTETGTASWVGSLFDEVNFVLEVNFDTQSIEAFVNYGSHGYNYLIKGDYDVNGLISGTVARGSFTDNNRNKPSSYGYIWESTLTGLIGKEGAVGIYRYGGFVARPADLVVDENTNKNAETFLNETCAADPFHQFCYLSNHRKIRLDDCITGNNVLNDNCKKAREVHPCIRHPFHSECKTTFPYHNDTMNKPYYQLARANRSAFCKETANATDDFCTGAERLGLCSYDPFHTLCDNANGLYNNARKAVCKAGFDHPDCATESYTTTSDNVTAISWLAGLYKNNGVVPQSEPDSNRSSRRNQLLQGTANGLDNGDVEIFTYSSGQFYRSLNLNTATFDGLELGGIATGGVAYFHGVNSRSYVGILSGTDLGAPLVRPTDPTKFKTKWYGQFQVGTYLKRDFTLDIDFGAGGTDGSVGTVEAFINNSYNDYFLLEGDFDDNGVISGAVFYEDFPNHDKSESDLINRRTHSILTGLIGTEGAVGVFYIGGFVAVPEEDAPLDSNVKFSDWVKSFGDTPPLPPFVRLQETQQTRFLQGRETDLRTVNLWNVVRPDTPLTLADVNTDGQSADGVAYMSGIKVGKKHHYVGILSGTYLGAVLPTVPAGANGAITATWDGKLGLIANHVEIPKRDIKVTVDFTNSKLKIADSNISNTHFVSFGDGIGWDNHGVLRGTINYRAASDGEDSKGIVRGLIGKDGAVAAFRSDHGKKHTDTNTPYAGGFVAVPGVNYLNWMDSFGNPTSLPAEVPWYAETQQQTQFLQGTGTGLNTRLIGNRDLETLDFANSGLGGEATDGVAYVFKNWEVRKDGVTVTVPRHFAGILSGTSLGAVLKVKPAVDGTDIKADWAGKLGMIVNLTTPVERSITLEVNYTDQNITLNRTAIGLGAVSFTNVGWDNTSGVLTGAITYDPNDSALADSTGKVTGLIGQQGAVGAFISNHVSPGSNKATYAGGFVAVPPAETASP